MRRFWSWICFVLTRARAVYRRSDPEPTEALLGLLHFVYGGWFMAPWDTIASHPHHQGTAHGYHYTELLFGGEVGIGLAALAIGGMQALGCVAGFSLRSRQAVSLLATLYWTLVCAGFVDWNWQSTATPIYGGLALAHLWVAGRLREEARPSAILEALRGQ